MKVLIAVDGTQATADTLDLACLLFADRPAEMILLYVIPMHLVNGAGGPVPVECYDLNQEQAHAQALIDQCVTRLKVGGIGSPPRTEIALGDPADVILYMAAKQDSDLIMLGRRGRGLLKRTLLGSVSTKVMTHAHCAVLVAHQKVEKS
ncbi:MAG TPA: universal stress protein [Chloroflexota bacterium]|nr:universal stress protein [Chloroflexota bacterium]